MVTRDNLNILNNIESNVHHWDKDDFSIATLYNFLLDEFSINSDTKLYHANEGAREFHLAVPEPLLPTLDSNGEPMVSMPKPRINIIELQTFASTLMPRTKFHIGYDNELNSLVLCPIEYQEI